MNATPTDRNLATEMPNYASGSIWLRILASLAVVITACGIKNYLAVAVSGTASCPYLCPSVLPTDLLFSLPLLEPLFQIQTWAQEQSQRLVHLLFADPWNLATSLMMAPVCEELIFRGPMFLARRRVHSFLWWPIGISLSIIFALSHGRSGLALLPLFVLGVCGLWLIASTQRFWPTVALHFLHNFFFSSALVYQSFLSGD